MNIAGRQRMLSQKMIKEACLIASNTSAPINLDRLKDTVQTIEKSLRDLINGNFEMRVPPAPNTVVAKQLRRVEELWLPIKSVVDSVLASGAINSSQLA